MSRARQRAWRWGLAAETLGAWLLRAKGYRILAHRFSCPQGEIDLVARRRRVVAFVEVKARQGGGVAPEASISRRQRHRIERAAAVFLQRHPVWSAYDLRFDAILVTPWRVPRHLIDAWRPDY